MLGEPAQHGAISGRRGEADSRAEGTNRCQQVFRRGLLQKDRRGPNAQRKQNEPAQPEGERQRRRADEAVGRLRAQHVAAVAVAGRQHIAMKMHGPLGLAGRARGEADQADVVAGGIAGGKLLVAGLCHQGLERIGLVAAPVEDAIEIGRPRARLLHFLRQPVVAKRQPDLGLHRRIGNLLRAQQRHGCDHHAAGLDDGERGGHHHRAIGSAQQHAMTRHHPEIAREHVGEAVHALGKLRIGDDLGRRDQARPVAMTCGDPSVEQLHHAVHPLRIVELRQSEQKVRPLLARGQVVTGKRVAMRRRGHAFRSSHSSRGCPAHNSSHLSAFRPGNSAVPRCHPGRGTPDSSGGLRAGNQYPPTSSVERTHHPSDAVVT